ncbi:hypothetical protein [Roseivirga pacifica]|uniref:hypothetical protein n=1 Tax=Roseivirga pacifica TaxID=1267423 RepID=UPI00227C8C7E|nr:hypothetical protein [Roseivirga pacifica]
MSTNKSTPQPEQGTYLLSPGAGIKVTFTPSPNAYLEVNGSKVASISVGTVGSSTGAAEQFTMHNLGKYAEANIVVEYGDAKKPSKAYCHMDFFLSGSTSSWSRDNNGLPNNCDTVIPASSTPESNGNDFINIPVVAPTGGVPSGVPSKHQFLNKDMVFMVDQAGSNLLFRGNSPLAPAKVANGPQPIDFDTLHAYMEDRYDTQTGTTGKFPKKGDYVLVDVCLLSPNSEAGSITQEVESFLDAKGKPGTMADLADRAFFPTTPQTVSGSSGILGQMCNWVIQPDASRGSTDDAYDQKSSKLLYDYMNTANDKPYVYYIHCASGHDRTGIVASTYLMRQYSSFGLSEAFIYGTTIAKLPAGIGGGKDQLQPDCNDISTGKEDPNRSRCLLIATVYNETVQNIYNTLNNLTGSSAKSLSTQALAKDPANVYDNYPWQTS